MRQRVVVPLPHLGQWSCTNKSMNVNAVAGRKPELARQEVIIKSEEPCPDGGWRSQSHELLPICLGPACGSLPPVFR